MLWKKKSEQDKGDQQSGDRQAGCNVKWDSQDRTPEVEWRHLVKDLKKVKELAIHISGERVSRYLEQSIFRSVSK